jgi:hypothetical protein
MFTFSILFEIFWNLRLCKMPFDGPARGRIDWSAFAAAFFSHLGTNPASRQHRSFCRRSPGLWLPSDEYRQQPEACPLVAAEAPTIEQIMNFVK